MSPEILQQIIDSQASGRRFVTLTNLTTGAVRLVFTDVDTQRDDPLFDAALAAQRSDRPTTVSTSDGELFINVFNPPLRLIVIGAVHVTQHLAPMAEMAGYRVTVVDPRRAWATAQRFEGVEIVHQWPDAALRELRPDRRTAVVTLTHDPKFDDRALSVALGSDCFYIGSLGSRKTHAARCERLVAAGFDAGDIARINGPVGLDIGASTPAEIAVSILAQITAALRRDRRVTNSAPDASVAAILLAAGQSRRMGELNKLLAEIEGVSMVARAADALVQSKANPIIVVTGHDEGEVRAALEHCDVEFAHNPEYASGLASSLKTGLSRVPPECAGVLVALGDMPYVRATHLDRLIDTFACSRNRICIPANGGQRGNPVLLPSRFFAELQNLSGDVGARGLISDNEALVTEVHFDDDSVIIDIDEPSVLQNLVGEPHD